MIGLFITIAGLATAVATYVYLDWSVWQIIGALFVVTFATVVDENGPKWRQALWAMLAFLFMVVVHFVITDNIIYWGELFLAMVMFLVAISCLFGMMNHKPGDGSTLTVYFLGLILCTPIGFLFLYQGLEGLGYQ